MQNLPLLRHFTRENPQGDKDNLGEWIELLEERKRLAEWSKEQHLQQVWAHLTKTTRPSRWLIHMLNEREQAMWSSSESIKKVIHPMKESKPYDLVAVKGLKSDSPNWYRGIERPRVLPEDARDWNNWTAEQSLARRAFPEYNKVEKSLITHWRDSSFKPSYPSGSKPRCAKARRNLSRALW